MCIWIILRFSLSKGITELQIHGENKLLTNWCNNQCTISSLVLAPLLERIVESMLHLQHISFNHVYRELIIKVEELSKEAIVLEEGSFVIHEHSKNSLFSAVHQFVL